jgi:hypothetical protein
MPYVLKTSPCQLAVGDHFEASENAMYDGLQIAQGDRLFVWHYQTEGGEGLVCSAFVEDVQFSGRRVSLRATVDRLPTHTLTINDLRNAEGRPTPMGELCRKLYNQSHGKVCQINQDAADLMETYFQT